FPCLIMSTIFGSSALFVSHLSSSMEVFPNCDIFHIHLSVTSTVLTIVLEWISLLFLWFIFSVIFFSRFFPKLCRLIFRYFVETASCWFACVSQFQNIHGLFLLYSVTMR
ncbi:hypothetical protein L9F63_025648, partial [Diploptera punctata]